MRASSAASGVVLAAGGAERFGGPLPKQLALFRGEPLVRRTARAALKSSLAEVLVVIGHRAEEVEAALANLPVTVVLNPAWAEGQSTSVRAGLTRVARGAGAAVFLPCDQPHLDASVIELLVKAWRDTAPPPGGGPIVVPTFGGRRGAPTLIDRSLFGELAALTGDTGGRQVIPRHPEAVVEVELPEEGPLLDVDTPEDLARLESLLRLEGAGGPSPRT